MLDRFFSALRRLLHILGLTTNDARATASAGATATAASAPAPAPRLGSGAPVGRPAPGSMTLAMPQLVANTGPFPTRAGPDPGPALFTLGMIQSFAGHAAIYDAPRANGQMVPLASNQPLFAIFGMMFGGQGASSFALPNLTGRVAAGGGFVGQAGPASLSLTYLIAVMPGGPPVGAVMPFGGNFAPEGWAVADGSLLPIRDYGQLFEAIGTTFGGDGASVFALPNLDPGNAPDTPLTTPLGVGAGPRQQVALDQRIPGAIGEVAGLGLNYLISVGGVFPTMGGGAFPADTPYVGQVIAYAGSLLPAGWAWCDGSLLPVANNLPLFQLIGTTYGGDGQASFALPDLRGRVMVGA